MGGNRVLIIEDEANVRFFITNFLRRRGFDVQEADRCATGSEIFATFHPNVVLADYQLPDGNAHPLLRQFKALDSGVSVIILTAHGSIELAVQAMLEGADHFLTKPIDLPSLLAIVERCLATQRSQRRLTASEVQQSKQAFNPFIGTSSAIESLKQQAMNLLSVQYPILLHGETGTGKGVLAHWLHDNGSRSKEAFVDINSAGLTTELLDAELFGYEKGAFTGAVRAKTGLLELAHQGTLFMDEIGDMSLQTQAHLLKVIEEKRFRRLGDTRIREVDTCLIAATHHNLSTRVREQKFREDLYFRINTLHLHLPPLRERIEDIPILSQTLLSRIAAEIGHDEITLSPPAVKALQRYAWPGNIRELRNVLERAVILTRKNLLLDVDLQLDFVKNSVPSKPTAELTLTEMERRHIRNALHSVGGDVKKAAIQLDIPQSTLYKKIHKYNLADSLTEKP